jgi:hypothetical protein
MSVANNAGERGQERSLCTRAKRAPQPIQSAKNMYKSTFSVQTWEVTFTVPADTPDDLRIERAFRFRVE